MILWFLRGTVASEWLQISELKRSIQRVKLTRINVNCQMSRFHFLQCFVRFTGNQKLCAAGQTVNRSQERGIATLLSLTLTSEGKSSPPVPYASSTHLTKHGVVWHYIFLHIKPFCKSKVQLYSREQCKIKWRWNILINLDLFLYTSQTTVLKKKKKARGKVEEHPDDCLYSLRLYR